MLSVPSKFVRNHPSVTENVGIEETGEIILNTVLKILNLNDYSNTHILDIGCGTRFAQTFINKKIPVKSYTGIDIDKELITYLQENVQEPNLEFIYLNTKNELYNSAGQDFQSLNFPLSNRKFDVIWLFSVFTHLKESDSIKMLQETRKHITNQGHLVFTCFLDDTISEPIVDIYPNRPCLKVHYQHSKMRDLITSNDWKILKIIKPQNYMAHTIVCQPK
jgi:SAM-dependent methyltransferase